MSKPVLTSTHIFLPDIETKNHLHNILTSDIYHINYHIDYRIDCRGELEFSSYRVSCYSSFFYVINISGFFSCYSESSAGSYASTSNSFIFSLRNKESLPPFKSNVTNPSRAIYRDSGYGPTFGNGHDIRIADNANSNANSYADFGQYNVYSVPSRVQDQYTILAGTRHFKPDDWEVFYLG